MKERCSEEGIVALLLKSGIRELEPTISYEGGPGFHSPLNLAEGECPNLNELLESLAEKGALRRSRIGSLPSCPSCHSFRLMVRFTCPVCGSTNVRRVDAIAHLPCGFVAPAEDFSVGDSLRCPNCGKALRAMGVDYNRLSGVVICEDCGKISLSPKLLFECADCGTRSSENELMLRPIYKYEVLREKLLAMRPLADEVARILRESGLEVISSREIIGISGIAHRFSLSVKGEEGEHLIDVAQGDSPVSEDRVLSLFGKMMDTYLNETTLVAVPKASEGAKVLAKSFNINLIEATSPEEAASKISDHLSSRGLSGRGEGVERERRKIINAADGRA